ncbi:MULTISPECIES: hypothetical protein [unclassified Variovorax]|uniref:hypothetical protein n=1 Tax=unclassified Variovorax TaxID=663243 RepID=UPI0025770C89|nr:MULTISPECIES: hypothetical protein [unclassified Variovorax]MDM0086550.1 hypothetical protein [Variovorax sp. J22G40]MDM0145194.1 hypothetical protein [Variovorax sp. J2P1-31]
MVRGLRVFQERFAPYVDQYVLIGGTAASLTMEEAGLEFRATKDLDFVLHVEVLTPAFGEAFWQFVEDGSYAIRQASDTGRPIFYRFQKPADDRYPAMVELFARAPDGLRPAEGSRLTPIPLDEAVSSLSAILLDEGYYAFVMAGRREVLGLPCIAEDRLIPLKAIAWLELKARKEQGAQVDAKDVRKHLNDVLRLSQLLTPATRIPLDPKINGDMKRFLVAVAADASIDLKTLQLGKLAMADVLTRLAQAYGIELPSQGGE